MAITPVGFVGTVQEASFSKMMSAVGGHGLIGTYAGTGFAASRVAGARSMSVQAGACWAPGVYVEMDATTTSPAAAANTSGLPRIDVVAMRIDWVAHTATLVNVAGSPNANPVPPAYANTSTTLYNQPGVKFDIPLRQSLLPSGDADYTAANIAAGDRRVWLQDGTAIQNSAANLPPLVPGRLVVHPETGNISVGGTTKYFDVNAAIDTGWQLLAITAPGGFTGTVYGYKRDGVAEIQITWTKGTGSATDATFAVQLPDGWFPATRDITRTIWAGGNPVRVYIGGVTGQMNFNHVTVAGGGLMDGGFDYIYKKS